MTVRTASEHVSNLPEFGLKSTGTGSRANWAWLLCPRCEGEFAVDLARFKAERRSVIKPDIIVRGRSCPYCQVTALPPTKVGAPVVKVRRRPSRSAR